MEFTYVCVQVFLLKVELKILIYGIYLSEIQSILAHSTNNYYLGRRPKNILGILERKLNNNKLVKITISLFIYKGFLDCPRQILLSY